MMNYKKTSKPKPRGRPQVSTLKRLTKSVTVKFSKPDYEKLRHRSKNANRTLAEYIRDAAFDARIVAKHSAEDAAIIRNLTGMANNLNQLTKLSHQTGFYRTKNIVMYWCPVKLFCVPKIKVGFLAWNPTFFVTFVFVTKPK